MHDHPVFRAIAATDLDLHAHHLSCVGAIKRLRADHAPSFACTEMRDNALHASKALIKAALIAIQERARTRLTMGRNRALGRIRGERK